MEIKFKLTYCEKYEETNEIMRLQDVQFYVLNIKCSITKGQQTENQKSVC